jgi:hypothetical protein
VLHWENGGVKCGYESSPKGRVTCMQHFYASYVYEFFISASSLILFEPCLDASSLVIVVCVGLSWLLAREGRKLTATHNGWM